MDTLSKNTVGEGDARGGRGRTPRRLSNDKLCYTVPEAAQLLGISRNFGYELARRGELPIVKFGKRMLVPIEALEKTLEIYPHKNGDKNEEA